MALYFAQFLTSRYLCVKIMPQQNYQVWRAENLDQKLHSAVLKFHILSATYKTANSCRAEASNIYGSRAIARSAAAVYLVRNKPECCF